MSPKAVANPRSADAASGVPDAWREFGRLSIEHLTAPVDAAPQARVALEHQLDVARAAFIESLDLAYPFSSIVANARLSPAASALLAIAVSCELDGRLARLVAHLNDDLARPRLTLQTIDQLMRNNGSSVAEVLGLDAPLRRCAFVEVIEDGPWANHALVVAAGVVWALVGDGAIDPLVPSNVLVVADDGTGGGEVGDDLVVVTGDDRILRRREAARRASATRFLVVDQPTETNVWNAIVREATLSGMGIIIELEEPLSAQGQRVIGRSDHLAWALSSRKELAIADMPNRRWREIRAEHRDPTSQDWNDAVGTVDAHRHHLSAEQLDLVGRAFEAHDRDLDSAVRRLMAGPLEQLAQRIRPTRTWDDIVLSPERLRHLHGIVDRYRYASTVFDDWGFSDKPSRGLVAMFSGPSGTGKTLAAEIVAGELGLDVFKLNLSAVVSKYIGETEKNLEQIFDAAGSGNVVLFFDEADSLFGKRSEVKDARDRYANIEVSYLLQRLERYDGVVLLATNFEKNVDDAFLRRIHARIEFPVPGSNEREQIWIRNFPAGAPVDDVDFGFLAEQFEMPGGAIRNAVIHAAFLAAAEGQRISMGHAVQAVAREYRKMGRLLKPDHFGPYFNLAKSAE
ncbi:MAG: ATP-binding protein [Ilumatobacteraceae bacterium]